MHLLCATYTGTIFSLYLHNNLASSWIKRNARVCSGKVETYDLRKFETRETAKYEKIDLLKWFIVNMVKTYFCSLLVLFELRPRNLFMYEILLRISECANALTEHVKFSFIKQASMFDCSNLLMFYQSIISQWWRSFSKEIVPNYFFK